MVGESAAANTGKIRGIVDHALAWESRSGATFEGEKTALVHFTRNPRLQSTTPLDIRGVEVRPQEETKVLGMVIDSELRFKNHIKKVSIKGLKAVLALKRMRTLTCAAARQLFNTTVVPIIDYASSVWMHILGPATTKTIRQIQKLGGQAIIGAFSSVAGAVSEAEAYILLI